MKMFLINVEVRVEVKRVIDIHIPEYPCHAKQWPTPHQ
jgi:hypothetical protein